MFHNIKELIKRYSYEQARQNLVDEALSSDRFEQALTLLGEMLLEALQKQKIDWELAIRIQRFFLFHELRFDEDAKGEEEQIRRLAEVLGKSLPDLEQVKDQSQRNFIGRLPPAEWVARLESDHLPILSRLDLLTRFGLYYESAGYLDKKASVLTAGSDLLTSYRAGIYSELFENRFAGAWNYFYGMAMEACAQNGNVPQAVRLAEQMRANVLFNRLLEIESVPIEFRFSYRKTTICLHQKLDHWMRLQVIPGGWRTQQMLLARERGEITSEALQAAKTERDQALLSLDDEIHVIQETYPDFHPIAALNQYPTLVEIQNHVASQPDTALVYLQPRPSGLFVFLVTAQQVDWMRVPLDSEQIVNMFNARRRSAPRTQGIARLIGIHGLESLFQPERFSESLDLLSHELDRLLWKKLVPKVVELGVSKLVLMPDSILAALPYMAALQINQESDPKRSHLKPYLLAFAPSSRVWSLCQKRAAAMPAGRKWLLVSGDESAQIGFVWPLYLQLHQSLGLDGEILWESDLTQDVFAKAAVNVSFIHVHLHGRFDQDDPPQSAFHLSNGKILTLDELSPNLSLDNTRLVVLSACESGEQVSEPAPNAIGFPSAFLRMGATAVLAATWKVSELSAVLLLSHFYAQLAQGHAIAEALQMAQLWLKNLTRAQTIEILQAWANDCKSLRSTIESSKWKSLSIARQQLIAIAEELQDEGNFLNALLENLTHLPDAGVEPVVLSELRLSTGGRKNWLLEIWSTLRDKIELGEDQQGAEWVKDTLSNKLHYPWASVYHWGGFEASGAVF